MSPFLFNFYSSLHSTCCHTCKHFLAAEEIENKYREYCNCNRRKGCAPVSQSHASHEVIQTQCNCFHICGSCKCLSINIFIPAENSLHGSYCNDGVQRHRNYHFEKAAHRRASVNNSSFQHFLREEFIEGVKQLDGIG